MTRRSAAPTAKAIGFFRRHRGLLPLAMRTRAGIFKALARAEAESSARGWRAEWMGDPDGDLMFAAVLRDPGGHSLAQEWEIFDPSRDCKRVVEARLALKALEER